MDIGRRLVLQYKADSSTRLTCNVLPCQCGKCERAGAECSVSPTEELIQQLTQELESTRKQLQLHATRGVELSGTVAFQGKEIERLKDLLFTSQNRGSYGGWASGPDVGPVITHLGRMVVGEGNAEFFAGSTTGVHFILSVQQKYQSVFDPGEHFPECLFRLHLMQPIGSSVVPDEDMHLGKDVGKNLHLSMNLCELQYNHLHSLGKTMIESAFEWYQQCWGMLYPVLLPKQFFNALNETLSYQRTSPTDYKMNVPFLLQVNKTSSPVSSHRHLEGSTYDMILRDLYAQMPSRGGLSHLQDLVLYLLYLQATYRHSSAIRVCGMAVRLAQSIGLHRHTRRFKYSPGEAELRKRLWWSVQSSILYGLPRTIRSADTDTDLPINTDYEDMYCDKLSFPLPGETTYIEPFIHYTQLVQVLSRCLEQMYTTTNRRGGVEKIHHLQRELEVWKQTVQSSLSSVALTAHYIQCRLRNINENSPYETLKCPDIIWLWLFILGEIASILIHRPALTFDPKEKQFVDSSQACTEAATRLILAFELSQEQYDWLAIWPSGYHLIFQSGLMLLYHEWSKEVTPAFGNPDGSVRAIGIVINLLINPATRLDGLSQARTPSREAAGSLRQAASYLQHLCIRTMKGHSQSVSLSHPIPSFIDTPTSDPSLIAGAPPLPEGEQSTDLANDVPLLWTPLSIDEINQMEIFEFTESLLVPWETL
ncbi:fungal-specific transcription factor domain-containing protein [Aspergillus avenaceus]|uniref:Fungal-specific transcription factor domain-containing protein n=1 Tax=Aspergillus avenaceus TaxID=36643 RepID=A0A5N6U6A8_ASPAV|nr:fungal-specific transcription factor domain-containing protein [Aspergillus avenaceus]